MAFLFYQTQGNIVPGNEYLPAGAIVPAVGKLMVMTDGNLAVASGTTRPTYLCVQGSEDGKALTAGDIIAVNRILPDMILATTWSAAATGVSAGDRVTISADGMQATATTTGGVLEVVAMEGTAVGDRVYVRVPAPEAAGGA